MKIYLTLDYELFFGESGTAQKCMIAPTDRIAEVCEGHGARCVLFVDAGYLDKLRTYSERFPQLGRELEQVAGQIRRLSEMGHDIQLHVHPHWEGTVYDGSGWKFDMSHYRLDTFSDSAVQDIFSRYVTAITNITQKPVSAFRAGGWCIQPFARFQAAFDRHQIRIDSTVFSGGKNSTASEWYDFSTAPDKDYWRFGADPCREDPSGRFAEYPIASYRVSPTFFWRLALTKLVKLKAHRSFGDGTPSANAPSQLARLLTTFSRSVVSIDGYKSSFLMKAYKDLKRNGRNHFVIIGHPKALSEYSLAKLDHFLSNLEEHDEVAIFASPQQSMTIESAR
jgi:hypothetical protein